MFETLTSEDDRSSMIEFLMQVKTFLLNIAYERYFERIDWQRGRFDFEAEHLELYRHAMDEYRDSGHFERLLDAVRDLDPNAIIDGGLGGAQLFVKRETVRVTERRFLRFPTFFTFKRLLEAIDVLLDSILEGTGAGTAIKELKDLAGILPKRERIPTGS